jgi:predicted AAA+ superfamily ATPase
VNVEEINAALLRGEADRPGLFPHLEALADSSFVFQMEFGLEKLPEEPGLILIRGPRQSGKSTWLEGALRDTITRFGPATALYLNGDHLRDADHLTDSLATLAGLFRPEGSVRRIFIDEITAVPDWPRGMKRALDAGLLRRVLVVTTGSKAADLRRGTERLPGRKGRLERTQYIFLPVSFTEFRRVCGKRLGSATLAAYLLTGGSPAACSEIVRLRRLPEWMVETTRDWILGECALAGRQRRSLVAVMEMLHRCGGAPLGQTKLAREAGLANNTVASGYLEMLADLMSVGLSVPWDPGRRMEMPRKPAKYPFVNLLVALAWSQAEMRAPEDVMALSPDRHAVWLEWLVAQELHRRKALRGDPEPERLPLWQGGGHELDFVDGDDDFIEVKRGATSPLEFAWFSRAFPRSKLTVVSASRFQTERVRGVTMEDFLQGA